MYTVQYVVWEDPPPSPPPRPIVPTCSLAVVGGGGRGLSYSWVVKQWRCAGNFSRAPHWRSLSYSSLSLSLVCSICLSLRTVCSKWYICLCIVKCNPVSVVGWYRLSTVSSVEIWPLCVVALQQQQKYTNTLILKGQCHKFSQIYRLYAVWSVYFLHVKGIVWCRSSQLTIGSKGQPCSLCDSVKSHEERERGTSFLWNKKPPRSE